MNILKETWKLIPPWGTLITTMQNIFNAKYIFKLQDRDLGLFGQKSNTKQDACQGVHSAGQNENGHKAVTRAFIGGGLYSLISVLPNELLFKSVIIRAPSKAF